MTTSSQYARAKYDRSRFPPRDPAASGKLIDALTAHYTGVLDECNAVHANNDYSRIDLSRVAEARAKLGQRLAAIAWVIEQAMERPQDIEGVVVKGEIFLVQSRPQTGLSH